jgi:class 3 adenylate cyclase
VVVLIDWARLKQESDIYENFETEGMQFKLTRTDVKDGVESVKVIAESSRSDLIAKDNITLDLDTGNNGWVISVGYDDGFSPNYKAWAYPIVFCAAFAFSILMMLVLVSKREHERILNKLMPKHALKKLRKGRTVIDRYKMVTIFFSDIVGYTKMSSDMTPEEVMKMLNDLYLKFDELVKKHKIHKVETIGDAYIAIGGAPKHYSGPEAAERVALFALDALKLVKEYRTHNGEQVFIRAGLASGPIVAGVIGDSLPKWSIFGDTVNIAARMEQTSKKMRLQISPSTQRMLLDAPNYNFDMEDRFDDDGEQGVECKGKGRQFTYWVNDAKPVTKDADGTDHVRHNSGMLGLGKDFDESKERTDDDSPNGSGEEKV